MFTYSTILDTIDGEVFDPVENKMKKVYACDAAFLTDSAFMGHVASINDNPASDGGIYYRKNSNTPYRSFREDVNLPGQDVPFKTAYVPFGFPAIHPTTGDLYITILFNVDDGKVNPQDKHQRGVYHYEHPVGPMHVIADTTTKTPEPPEGVERWKYFSAHVAVSASGAFFKGDYKSVDGEDVQGIFHYTNGNLVQIVHLGDNEGFTRSFNKLGAVEANDTTVVFVGEWADGTQSGVYSYNLEGQTFSTVIESGADADGHGEFIDFAIRPKLGLYDSSIGINNNGDIVLIATYRRGQEEYQGVFILKESGNVYSPHFILEIETTDTDLLGEKITDFNSVAINERGEIAFVVNHIEEGMDKDSVQAPYQGLVFYNTSLISVFKANDTCVADLKHSSVETSNHGGLVFGSQGFIGKGDEPGRLIFRSGYTVVEEEEGVNPNKVVLALATIEP